MHLSLLFDLKVSLVYSTFFFLNRQMGSTDDTYYKTYANLSIPDAVVPVGDEHRFDLHLFSSVSNIPIKAESDYIPSPDSDRLSIVTTSYVSDLLEELSNAKRSPAIYAPSESTSPASQQSCQVPIFNTDQSQLTEYQVIDCSTEGLKELQNREKLKIVIQTRDLNEVAESDPLTNANCILPKESSTSKHYHELDNFQLQHSRRSYSNECSSPSSENCTQVFGSYQDNKVNDEINTTNTSCLAQENEQNSNLYFLPKNTIKEERNSSPEYEIISEATSISSDEPESYNFKLDGSSNTRELQSVFQVHNRFNVDFSSQNSLRSNFKPQSLISEQKPMPNSNFMYNSCDFWNQNQSKTQYPVPLPSGALGSVVPQVIFFKRTL